MSASANIGARGHLNGAGPRTANHTNLAAALIAALDDQALDLLAERLASRLAGAPSEADGFLDVAGAAAFLACPPSRVYALVSARRIPHHRDGSRLLFDRRELREFVPAGGARRP